MVESVGCKSECRQAMAQKYQEKIKSMFDRVFRREAKTNSTNLLEYSEGFKGMVFDKQASKLPITSSQFDQQIDHSLEHVRRLLAKLDMRSSTHSSDL